MNRIISILFLTLIIYSCDNRKQGEVKNDGDVVSVEQDDSEINQAMAKARGGYTEFLNAFTNQDSTTENFIVKMKFDYEGGGVEHIWLNDLYRKEGRLYGVLDNDPVHVKDMKWGDTTEVFKDSVSDWMYIKNGKMVGGFTLLVLYNRMSEAEKKEFRSQIDFEIE